LELSIYEHLVALGLDSLQFLKLLLFRRPKPPSSSSQAGIIRARLGKALVSHKYINHNIVLPLMRREGCPKRERESFGDIYDVENYRGPWADFAERHASAAPAIPADRIVSKQNMQPGNEVCKM